MSTTITKVKYTTIEWWYSSNSLTLLNLLLKRASDLKTIVIYGKDAEFEAPKNCKEFYVITIYRVCWKEFKGFLNYYKVLS